MSEINPRNLPASVRQRLANVAQNTRQDYGLILTRYALERFLYRLSQSRHRDAFVLKGAMLFQVWTAHPHRPTRDVDFLGQGEYSVERFRAIFVEIFSQAVEPDGLTYLPATLEIETMKDEEEYPGLRVSGEARLGNARIPLLIDIGFGDAVTPGPVMVEYPTLLPFPAAILAAYPIETVVAEKFEAMIKLGIANSRMKDFFDLWVLARDFTFESTTLATAVTATFQRRKTPFPNGDPVAFTPEFYEDTAKTTQWRAFLAKNKLPGVTLTQTMLYLASFLSPIVQALRSGKPSPQRWHAGGPWLDR